MKELKDFAYELILVLLIGIFSFMLGTNIHEYQVNNVVKEAPLLPQPAYMRIRVLKTGTISWCASARADKYQTGDRVKVNLFTHMIVDNDSLANSCILLDSYSPDDFNNQ